MLQRLLIIAFLFSISAAVSLYSMQAGEPTEGFVGEGTIDIDAGFAERLLSIEAMAPGDVVTTAVKVENSGTLELGYTVISTTTEDFFAGQLILTLKVGVSDCAGDGVGSSDNFLYGPARLGSVGGINVVGEPAGVGQLLGRRLVPGESEVLCIHISLPLESGNEYQGIETSATFTFWAEQT